MLILEASSLRNSLSVMVKLAGLVFTIHEGQPKPFLKLAHAERRSDFFRAALVSTGDVLLELLLVGDLVMLSSGDASLSELPQRGGAIWQLQVTG